MVEQRPYREAVSPAEAVAELRAHGGSQFDAELVELFASVLEVRPAGVLAGRHTHP